MEEKVDGDMNEGKAEDLKLPEPFHPMTKISGMMDELNRSGEVLSHFIAFKEVEQLFYMYFW
jgi:hypothetical protein